MWNAISLVTSGITLVAFLAAVTAFVIMRRSAALENRLRATGESNQSALIEHTLEFFHVDSAGMTEEDRYRLALAQVNARSKRFQSTCLIVVAIAVLFTGLTAFVIARIPAGSDTASRNETNLLSPIPSNTMNLELARIPVEKIQAPYFVILGSFDLESNARRQVYRFNSVDGVQVHLVSGNDYPRMTNDKYAVIAPAQTASQAESLRASLSHLASDAYIKSPN